MKQLFLSCVLIVLLACSLYGNEKVLKLKPVGYWPCDDGKGDLVRDLSGNKNPGKINHVEWKNGLLNFTAAYQWIEVPKHKAYQTASFSLGGWVFARSKFEGGNWPSQSGMQFIGNVAWAQTDGIQIGIVKDELIDFTVSGTADIGYRGQDQLGKTDGRPTVALGKWQHLFFTYADGVGKLYLNGQMIQEKTNLVYRSADRNLRMANDAVWWHQSVKSGSLDGSLREMVWFDRALTADEVGILSSEKPKTIPPEPVVVASPAPREDMAALLRELQDKSKPDKTRAEAALALAALGPKAKKAMPVLTQMLEKVKDKPFRVEELLCNAVLRAMLDIEPGNATAIAALPKAPDKDAKYFTERAPRDRDYISSVTYKGVTYKVGEGVAWKGVEPLSAADYAKILERNPDAKAWRKSDAPNLFRVPIYRIDANGKEQKVYLEGEDFVLDGTDLKLRGWSLFVDRNGYIHLIGGQHNTPSPGLFIPGSWEKMGLSRSGYSNDTNFPGQLYWVSKKPESIDAFEFVGKRSNPRAIPAGMLNYMVFVEDNQRDVFLYGRTEDGHAWQSWGLFRYDAGARKWVRLGGYACDVIASARKSDPKWIEFLHDPIYGKVPEAQGQKVLAWAWEPAFYNFCRDDWGIRFDKSNRMHVMLQIFGLNKDGRNELADVYAYSDDGGQTFHRADGTKVELPLTINPAPEHNADTRLTGKWFGVWLSLLRDAGYKGLPVERMKTK